MAHLLRVARPNLIDSAARRHDMAVLRGLNHILGAADDLLCLGDGAAAAQWMRVSKSV